MDSGNKLTDVKFNFLINGELICESVEAHITSRGIPTESVIDIEYVEQQAPPTLDREFNHQDWVSCTHCNTRL